MPQGERAEHFGIDGAAGFVVSGGGVIFPGDAANFADAPGVAPVGLEVIAFAHAVLFAVLDGFAAEFGAPGQARAEGDKGNGIVLGLVFGECLFHLGAGCGFGGPPLAAGLVVQAAAPSAVVLIFGRGFDHDAPGVALRAEVLRLGQERSGLAHLGEVIAAVFGGSENDGFLCVLAEIIGLRVAVVVDELGNYDVRAAGGHEAGPQGAAGFDQAGALGGGLSPGVVFGQALAVVVGLIAGDFGGGAHSAGAVHVLAVPQRGVVFALDAVIFGEMQNADGQRSKPVAGAG